MKKPSIILSLLAPIFLLVGNLIYSQPIEAAETQTVYLHKQVTKPNQTGQGMLTEKQGINGVEFTVIDITHFVRTYSTSHEEALEKAKAMTQTEVIGLTVGQTVPNRLGMKVIAKEKTAQLEVPNKQGQTETMDGVLKLSLAKKNKSHDASYLFIETDSVSQADPSDSIILHFPVEDEPSNVAPNEVIHVYSKNDRLSEFPTEPKIEKKLTEDHADFTYGEAINYEIKVTIPTQISNYQYFKVIDTPDPELLVDVQSIKITDKKGQAIDSNNYQVNAKENGFTVDFLTSKLLNYQDTQLKISYQLTIKIGAAVDTLFYNKAFLQFNDSLKDQEKTAISKEVLTGGYRFIKVDESNHESKLKDATFVVSNKEGNYLTAEYKWKTSDKPAKDEALLKLVSNQEGAFELKGLAYGEYQIEETVAPKGYRRLQNPIDFKIEKNTYEAGKTTGILEVVNSKLTSIVGEPNGGKISNNLRRLPRTGEKKLNIGLLGVLLILLAPATYSIRKRQKQRDN